MRLLSELSNLSVDDAEVQETHFGSARGVTRLVVGDSLPMELGARLELLEQI